LGCYEVIINKTKTKIIVFCSDHYRICELLVLLIESSPTLSLPTLQLAYGVLPTKGRDKKWMLSASPDVWDMSPNCHNCFKNSPDLRIISVRSIKDRIDVLYL